MIVACALPAKAAEPERKASYADRTDQTPTPAWYAASLVKGDPRDTTPPTNNPPCTNCVVTPSSSEFTNDFYLLWNAGLRVPHDANATFYARDIGQHFLIANPNQATLWSLQAPDAGPFSTGVEPGGVAGMEMDKAWPLQPHASNVVAVVIDTGVDGGHPDLQANLVPWAATNSLTDSDTLGHGTGVCGIIGASSGNTNGIAGICRKVQLWPIKTTFTELDLSVSISNVAWFASTNTGSRFIINLSLGFKNPSREPTYVRDAILWAHSNGVIVCAAAINADDGIGNQDAQNDYPISWRLPNVIAVGGHTRADGLYSYVGTNLHVMAGSRLVVTTADSPTLHERCPGLLHDHEPIHGRDFFRDTDGNGLGRPALAKASRRNAP